MKVLSYTTLIHFKELPDVGKCDFNTFATLKFEDTETSGITLFFRNREDVEKFIEKIRNTEWELPMSHEDAE